MRARTPTHTHTHTHTHAHAHIHTHTHAHTCTHTRTHTPLLNVMGLLLCNPGVPLNRDVDAVFRARTWPCRKVGARLQDSSSHPGSLTFMYTNASVLTTVSM